MLEGYPVRRAIGSREIVACTTKLADRAATATQAVSSLAVAGLIPIMFRALQAIERPTFSFAACQARARRVGPNSRHLALSKH